MKNHCIPRLLLAVFAFCLLAFPSFPQDNGKLRKASRPVANSYIVILDETSPSLSDSFSPLALEKNVKNIAAGLTAQHGGRVTKVFKSAVKGFSVVMSPKRARAMSLDSRVKYIEEDFIVAKEETQLSAPWGLDRIDQRRDKNSTYIYDTTGSGVNAYVIDSGIRATHTQFGGRVVFGADFVNDGQNGGDCDGHGTHVAGILGGLTYGVAKNVAIHNVRVLNCEGRGTGTAILSAIEWVTNNHVAPAVANVSIGMDGVSVTLENAISNSIKSGVHYALSAGNENVDACGHSPGGRVPTAITVAATDEFDERSLFGDGDGSNFGACVDVFAPGSNITSAWHTSDTALAAAYGTSMSSPFVAGAIARFLQANPAASPAEVKTSLLNSASHEVVRDAGAGSPNRLLFSTISLNARPPIAMPMNSVANPYPSEITLEGMPEVLSSVPGAIQVNINELTAVMSSSVSFVLVGPTGAAILLQGHAGHNSSPSGISYTISDTGTLRMSESPLVNGAAYQPTRVLNFPAFPAPGPSINYNDPGRFCCPGATLASTFGGTNPNGVWRLYAMHQGVNLTGVGGSIASWGITITNPTPPPTPTPTPDPTPTPSPTPPLYPTEVSFVGTDTTTKGNWRAGWGTPSGIRYGGQAWSIVGGGSEWFSWIGQTRSGGALQTWASSTTDPRGLYKFYNSDTRAASSVSSATHWELNYDFSDGQPHRLAYYCVDWDNSGRRQLFELFDGTTGELLDSRSISDFSGGIYLVWNVRGRFKVRVTNTAGEGTNAVISGTFIDPAGGLPPPLVVPATIRGRAIQANGSGLPHVRIVATLSDGSQRYFQTNTSGYFTLANLPTGSVKLTLSKKSGQVLERTIELSTDLNDQSFVFDQ